MLKLHIPKQTLWDEDKERFIKLKNDVTLNLEHSLLSVSKWEQKWKKPFLSCKNLTHEETISYIKCMTINTQSEEMVYYAITDSDIDRVNEYISDSATATFFNISNNKKEKDKIITTEVIYYWMVAYQIPFSCEKWHLNRLLTLIKVCNEENKTQEDMIHKGNKIPNKKFLSDRAALNKARRNAMNSKG